MVCCCETAKRTPFASRYAIRPLGCGAFPTPMPTVLEHAEHLGDYVFRATQQEYDDGGNFTGSFGFAELNEVAGLLLIRHRHLFGETREVSYRRARPRDSARPQTYRLASQPFACLPPAVCVTPVDPACRPVNGRLDITPPGGDCPWFGGAIAARLTVEDAVNDDKWKPWQYEEGAVWQEVSTPVGPMTVVRCAGGRYGVIHGDILVAPAPNPAFGFGTPPGKGLLWGEATYTQSHFMGHDVITNFDGFGYVPPGEPQVAPGEEFCTGYSVHDIWGRVIHTFGVVDATRAACQSIGYRINPTNGATETEVHQHLHLEPIRSESRTVSGGLVPA